MQRRTQVLKMRPSSVAAVTLAPSEPGAARGPAGPKSGRPGDRERVKDATRLACYGQSMRHARGSNLDARRFSCAVASPHGALRAALEGTAKVLTGTKHATEA